MQAANVFGNMTSQLTVSGEISYKDKKFVVCMLPSDHGHSEDCVIVLSDMDYWLEQYDALQHWCSQKNCTVSGMTVTIPDQNTLTMFCLTWS